MPLLPMLTGGFIKTLFKFTLINRNEVFDKGCNIKTCHKFREK